MNSIRALTPSRVRCLLTAFALAFAGPAFGQLGMERDQLEKIYGTIENDIPVGKDAIGLPPIQDARSYPTKYPVELTIGYQDGTARYVRIAGDFVRPEHVAGILERCTPKDKRAKPISWTTDVAQTAVFPPLGKLTEHKGTVDGTIGPKMVKGVEVTHMFRQYSNGYRKHISSRVNTDATIAIPGSESPTFNYATGHGVERLIRVRAGEQEYVTIEARFDKPGGYEVLSFVIADADTHWRVLLHSLMNFKRNPAAPWVWGEPGIRTYDAVLSSVVPSNFVSDVYDNFLIDLVIAATERDQLRPDLLQEVLSTVSAEKLARQSVDNLKGVSVAGQRRRVLLLGELPAKAAVPHLIPRLSVKSLQGDAVATLQLIAARDPGAKDAAAALGSSSAKWKKWWDLHQAKLP